MKKIIRLFRDHPFGATFLTLWFGYVFCFSVLFGALFGSVMTIFSSHPVTSFEKFASALIGIPFGFIYSLPIWFLCPVAWFKGTYYHGMYATMQIPLVLGCVGIVMMVAWLLPRKPPTEEKLYFQSLGNDWLLSWIIRKKLHTIALAGIITYMIAIHITNLASSIYTIDHSKDFPFGRKLEEIRLNNNHTCDDVREILGVPLAEAVFESDDPLLHISLREILSDFDRDRALIYAYYEEDDWGNKRRYFILFDSSSGEYFNRVLFYEPFGNEYWPNKKRKTETDQLGGHV